MLVRRRGRLLTVKAYWRMSGSMFELFELFELFVLVCLLAGKAEAPITLVRASAAVGKKRMMEG